MISLYLTLTSAARYQSVAKRTDEGTDGVNNKGSFVQTVSQAYRKIPSVLSPDELLDKAFKRANRIAIMEKNRLKKEKELSLARLNSISDTITYKLALYVKTFPSLNRESKFEEAIIDLVIGTDELKHSLGALQWAAGTTRDIIGESRNQIKRSQSIEEVARLRKSAYGRVSSVVKRVGKELAFLANAREELKVLPTIDPDVPTVVVAGAPNVGKSMIVTRLSSAKPQIASYPFTTKNIHVGVFVDRRQRYQILDTPGLLDRPLSQRNEIEKQAVLALQYLPHLILFVLDPSYEGQSTIDEQMDLLESLKKDFPSPSYILVANKMDMAPPPSGVPGISALTGEGVEEMRQEIVAVLCTFQATLEDQSLESSQGQD